MARQQRFKLTLLRTKIEGIAWDSVDYVTIASPHSRDANLDTRPYLLRLTPHIHTLVPCPLIASSCAILSHHTRGGGNKNT